MGYTKTAINIHHTAKYAENDVAKQLKSVDAGHKSRWNASTKSELGYYVGYHYLIERDGEVVQCRNDLEIGVHNNKGIKWSTRGRISANYYAIGISFAGNMSRQHLTDAQIVAGVELIEKIQREYGILDDQVLPHRHYTPTQCPGNNLPDPLWEYLKEKAEAAHKPQSEPAIVTWNKEEGIIEKWSDNPTELDIKLGWIAKKICDRCDDKIKELDEELRDMLLNNNV